jgi:DNA-binding NtrC family response regulator
MNTNIMIVEDDPNTLEGLAEILNVEKFSVVKAKNGREALEALKNNNINLVLIDFLLPDRDGLDISKTILENSPDIKIVIMTAFGSVKNAVDAMKLGIYDYLTKPIDLDELLIIIRRALKEQELIYENIDLKEKIKETYSFENIIGVSGKMQEVFRKILKVASTDATVLIRGESGTGKELIARAIHYQSSRRDKSLIEINCASIPETLLESELFGHEKGAFTGAYKSKKGKFEIAHQGSLFLDEIGELPLSVQAKLLRVLQDGSFTRVGGIENIGVDVRLIAATNADLEKAIATKKIRDDLYYRLNVVPIFIPPLRDRREDIGPLIEHFIKKYANKNGRNIKGDSKKARNALLTYSWPGNVRELENAIENAVIMSESEYIQLEDLPGYLQIPITINGTNNSSIFKLYEENINLPFKDQISYFGKEIIKHALEDSNGNKTHTAKKLGFSIRTLRNKIQQYKI